MIHEQQLFLNMKVTQIIDHAIENLKSAVGGLTINFVYKEPKSNDNLYDGYLEISKGGSKEKLFAEIKNEVRHPHLADFIKRFGNNKRRWIVIANYIPTPLKTQFKELDINYLESSGNSFIDTKNIFLFINDQKVTPNRLVNEGKLWNPSGLKFIFSLLNKEGLLDRPYRQIATAAGIALGNVGLFIDALNKEGYLIKTDKGHWLLVNREMLIKRWIELYHTVLRPKISMGRFKFISSVSPLKWKSWPTEDFVWGGENAGALLTNYLSPQDFTIYTHLTKMEVMKSLKLVPSTEGKVEVLEQFWPMEIQEVQDVSDAVPPLIAYAELIISLDSRNRETAERIKL